MQCGGLPPADRELIDIRNQVEAVDTFDEANLTEIMPRSGRVGFNDERDYKISPLFHSHTNIRNSLRFFGVRSRDVEILIEAEVFGSVD